MQDCPNFQARRHGLLDRIHRHYQTTSTIVQIDQLSLPFTRIADPDRVLDVVAEADESEPQRLPYWAELWDSAIGLGQWLGREDPAVLHQQSVLDLGCGMGLAGTVAAHRGASVLFADIEPLALLFAQLNTLASASRIRTRCLDWRTDQLPERFDLILGADILYEREQWEHLEPFWRAHLKPTGRVLLGEPGRQTGDLFIPWIRSQNWMLLEHSESVPTRAVPIRLFELSPT